jgi:peptide-methionine (R)-S-oxide reductase
MTPKTSASSANDLPDPPEPGPAGRAPGGEAAVTPVRRTPGEWKEVLTPEQFHVLREHGTERAFSSHSPSYDDAKATFLCAGCGLELFRADEKYDSGSGWPSFYAPASSSAVETERDVSHGMTRVEVHCARCAGHLGHIFNDGPQPTGLRYCINAVALHPVVARDDASEAGTKL